MEKAIVSPMFDIPRLTEITIDGDEADWQDQGFHVDVMASRDGQVRPQENFDPTFRLGWNDEGLLVLVNVRDDAAQENPVEDLLWQNDSVEIFVGREQGSPEYWQVVISPGVDENHPDVRHHFYDHRVTKEPEEPSMSVARKKTDGGYVLEALLPWANLGIEPKEGLEVGLQLYVNDSDRADGGDRLTLPWYPDNRTFGNPHLMHRVRLSDKPSPPVNVCVAGEMAPTGYSSFTVVGTKELVGKTVKVGVGGRAVVSQTLKEQDGRAVADIMLSQDQLGKPYDEVSIVVDKKCVRGFDCCSRLRLAGDGHWQDSFSLAAQAAAGMLGKDGGYEMVACLSSNVFSPVIDLGESCTAWWHVQAWQGDRAMETIAARIGLKARRLKMPPLEGDWSNDEDVRRQRKACVKVLREAMEQGEVILVTGGWEVHQDDRFVPWLFAGIITGVKDGGTILGACLNGRCDNRMRTVSNVWAISRGPVTLEPHEADLKMLRNAVARIRGNAEPFLSSEYTVYGLAAMDAWIAKMKTVPFCEDCFKSAPDRVWTCAHSTGTTAMSGARTAASYLRKRKDVFCDEAQPHIEAAAGHYDAIVQLLLPALEGEGEEHYKKCIGDLEKQKEHAETVLVPVKAELAAAADEMEKALVAEGRRPVESDTAAHVKRERGRVVIEGVPNMPLGGLKDDWAVLLRGMQVLLAYRGEKTTLNELMAYSGDAFHLCHATLWELRTCYSIPSDTLTNVAQAYGYAGHWIPPRGFFEMRDLEERERRQQTAEYLERIWGQIDKGRPVMMGGAYGHCGMWRVVVGYDLEKEKVCYVGGDTPDYDWTDLYDPKVREIGFWDSRVRGAISPNFFGGWKANTAFLMEEKQRDVTERERMVIALWRAVDLFRAGVYMTDGRGTAFAAGKAAYEGWARDLHDLDYPADAEKPRPKGGEYYDMTNMVYQVDQIVRGRTAAAEFCRKAAKVLPASEKPLLAAAKAYEEEVAIAKKAFAVFLDGKQEGWKAWLSDEANREAGVVAIREMLAKETAAIAEIEKVRAVERIEVPTGVGGILAHVPVKREDGKVWIEGVPQGEVGGGPEGMLRGLAILLRHRGEKVDETDLIAYSGDAFHLCFATKWQFMGYMAVPADIVDNVLSAYGYDGGLHHSEAMPNRPEVPTAIVLENVYARIDAGRPVLVGGCSDQGCSPWSVVVGYDRKNRELCHIGIGKAYRWTKIRGVDIDLNDTDMGTAWNSQTRGAVKPGFVGGWLDNAHIFLGNKTSDPDQKSRTLAALGRAVQLHRATVHDPHWGWKFYFGAAAYKEWGRALHELDYPADAEEPQLPPFWGLYDLGEMARMVHTIVRCRTVAAEFCRQAVAVLPASKESLLAAAKAYDEEVAIAKKAFAVFLDGEKEAWETWLSEEAKREAGVAAIAEMLEKEKAAIAEIEKVLAAEGVEVATGSGAEIRTLAVSHKYGFRYDPMKFVENDKTLQGAMVRRVVFKKPKLGDKEILAKRIDEILAMQRPDGSIVNADNPSEPVNQTGNRLLEAVRLGAPGDRAEVRRAVDYIRKHPQGDEGNKFAATYGVHAMCLMGRTDEPVVHQVVKGLIDNADDWIHPYDLCPWTPIVQLKALWAARDVAVVDPIIARGLKMIADGISDAGCLAANDPWGYLDCAGAIDHPLCKTIVEKQVPMILRAQDADGGWGDRSLIVFRALKKYGLLEKLADLPPAPADWKIIRSIPAPEGDLFTMTWDGKRLWVFDKNANEAVAVSPEDGKVLKRIKLPVNNIFGIGWWDDGLAATQSDPKRLLQIDPETGTITRELSLEQVHWMGGVAQVGDQMWVSDVWNPCIWAYDPARPERPQYKQLAGPVVKSMAVEGDAVWHIDWWAPAIIKSGLDGRLLDWGEKPFDGRCEGIAFDGQHLWALDAKNKRICIIEKVK